MAKLLKCIVAVNAISSYFFANASPLQIRNAPDSASPCVRMPFKKWVAPGPQPSSSQPSGITVSLSKNRIEYFIEGGVGTPRQTVKLQLDTGSSDTWVHAPNSNGSADGGKYDPSVSSTAVDLHESFTFRYGTAGSIVKGEYFSDSFSVGPATVHNLAVGVATFAINEPYGILGVGLTAGESVPNLHPTILDQMYKQGLIGSISYSLYLDSLNANTGEIIFGGIDHSKYSGDLVTLPIVPAPDDVARLDVELFSLNVKLNGAVLYTSASSASLPWPVLLDSGTTSTYLPPQILDAIVIALRGSLDPISGYFIVPCSLIGASGGLDFTFGFGSHATIHVPFSEVVLDSGVGKCILGLLPTTDIDFILGDTFLRSAYVYYDLGAGTISLAQAVFT